MIMISGGITFSIIRLIPRRVNDTFNVFLSVRGEIIEQYDPKKMAIQQLNFEQWLEKREYWTGDSDYVRLQDFLTYYFRLPIVNTLNGYFEKKRESLAHLSDTFVDRSSESQNIASLLYHEVPCLYSIPYGVLKIQNTDQPDEVKYLKIVFSYGC